MDIKKIKNLVDLVEKAEISHLSVDIDGAKIEIKKEFSQVAPVSSVVLPQQQAAPLQQAPATQETKQEAAPKDDENDLTPVKAEMVGTFYSASSPDAKPYVSVGSAIKKGQIICVIEAMKLFNEIESDISGSIEKICVENGQPVEYGQTLFLVKTS